MDGGEVTGNVQCQEKVAKYTEIREMLPIILQPAIHAEKDTNVIRLSHHGRGQKNCSASWELTTVSGIIMA